MWAWFPRVLAPKVVEARGDGGCGREVRAGGLTQSGRTNNMPARSGMCWLSVAGAAAKEQ